MLKKRYTIALFIGHIENKFSEEVMLGAAHAAEQLDVNLVVFPVRFIESIQHDLISKKYQYQYNCMFSYAENNSFDAIIIETAVTGHYVNHDTTAVIIEKFKDTPVITISQKIENNPCISFNSNGIELAVEHLIRQHNRKRIGFVGGPSTNSEAVLRLEKYKSSLIKHNIEIDPDLIVEGDFTEFCNEPIANLLEKNKGNIDAICFANDAMAIPGYYEIAKRGLKVGSDIMVTGFDDIPSSASLSPSLTTVHASFRDLGCRAVYEALNSITNSAVSDITVDTTLVKRNSCGCKSSATIACEALNGMITNPNSDAAEFVNKLHDTMHSFYLNTNYQPKKRIINLFLKFTFIFLSQVSDPEKNLEINTLMSKFNTLLRHHILDLVSVENFNFLLSSICEKAVSIVKPEDKQNDIFRIFMSFYKEILVYKHGEDATYKSEIQDNIHCTNSIMDSIIENSESSDTNYVEIMRKLRSLNIKSSYLYLHESPVISHSRYDWVQPESEILQAYHIGDNFHSMRNSSERRISRQSLFKNDYMPANRFTFIASPIFFSEENYGLLLCDMNLDDYIFYNSIITSQLSYAIKLRSMLDDQMLIQSHLIDSLNKAQSSNKMLSQISKSDELTGIYNRRGFIENVINSIKRNSGRRAVIIYADMDNLKQINDLFGHDEGDYAIKKASEALRECVRSNDITARFGGDEFAAFALIYESDFKEMFIERLNNICTRINRTNNKPYNIYISVGMHEFVCNRNIDLTKIINEADKVLYINKKHKNKSIIKSENPNK